MQNNNNNKCSKWQHKQIKTAKAALLATQAAYSKVRLQFRAPIISQQQQRRQQKNNKQACLATLDEEKLSLSSRGTSAHCACLVCQPSNQAFGSRLRAIVFVVVRRQARSIRVRLAKRRERVQFDPATRVRSTRLV